MVLNRVLNRHMYTATEALRHACECGHLATAQRLITQEGVAPATIPLSSMRLARARGHYELLQWLDGLDDRAHRAADLAWKIRV